VPEEGRHPKQKSAQKAAKSGVELTTFEEAKVESPTLLLPAYTIIANGGNLLLYRGSGISLQPDYRVDL
jgi:hypothetical protein